MVWPVWAGAAIAGGLSAAGGLLTNRSAKKESQRNRDFQERMSNTAHQRQVKDLRLAGLNPILSAKGSGASSPGGSMAPVTNPLASATSSALSVIRQKADVQNIEAVTEGQQNKNVSSAWDAYLAQIKLDLAKSGKGIIDDLTNTPGKPESKYRHGSVHESREKKRLAYLRAKKSNRTKSKARTYPLPESSRRQSRKNALPWNFPMNNQYTPAR